MKKSFFGDLFLSHSTIKQFDFLKMWLSLPSRVVEWSQVKGYFGWKPMQSSGNRIFSAGSFSHAFIFTFSKIGEFLLCGRPVKLSDFQNCETVDKMTSKGILYPKFVFRDRNWWIHIWEWHFCHPTLVVLSISIIVNKLEEIQEIADWRKEDETNKKKIQK
jgi:hypothetical protein